MSLPSVATLVEYPAGAVRATGEVLFTQPAGAGLAVVLDRTAIHPVDAGWPDQPADAGALVIGGAPIPLLGAVVAATDGAELFLGDDIPVRTGTDGWVFLAAHLVAGDAAVTVGDRAETEADPELRRRLSLGHSACHLASLALNAALAPRWTKAVGHDALGHPDFDRNAIDRSQILPGGSEDRYRLGKSLRKKGFDVTGLAEALPELAAAAQEHLDRWIRADATVRIDREGPHLTDRRYWVCALPEATALIPCGGTHATSTAELAGARIELSLAEAASGLELVMRVALPES